MLPETKNQNFPCDYADELISYLYGESESASSENFKIHLKQCAHCSSEAAEFSLLRSSISAWREQEFANLQTPRILISFGEARETAPKSSNTAFIEKIRAFFTHSPVLTSSFAGVALIIGLGFALYNFSDGNQTRQTEIALNENQTARIIENKQPVPNFDENTADKTDESGLPAKTENAPAEENASVVRKQKVVETSVKTNRQNVGIKTVRTSANTNKAVKNTQIGKRKNLPENPPTLLGNDDVAEAQPLRLSDIFSELDEN